MKHTLQPVVYISYNWLTNAEGRRVADPRAEKLGERLRSVGVDARLDVFFYNNKYGFSAPTGASDEKLDPWLTWAGKQVKDSDCVILFCTPEYANSYRRSESWLTLPEDFKERLQNEEREKVASLWWDFHFMKNELNSAVANKDKFIPVSFGYYDPYNIPSFIKGQTCYNIEEEEQFAGLIKAIKKQYRKKHPRSGIFISYAHLDEPKWIDSLLLHLSPLEKKGVQIWTDKDLITGDRFHNSIQNSLANAKIAILMVTPAFVSSNYIAKHELPPLLEAAEHEGLIIFWIPVKPAQYPDEVEQLQAAHPPKKPLSTLRGSKLDQAFVDIASKLLTALGM